MARARLLQGSISTSEKLDQLRDAAESRKKGLGEFAQLLWTWTYLHCDDFGRFDRSPKTIKARVMPFSSRPIKDFEDVIDLWHEISLNVVISDGEKRCTYFIKFEETQGSFLRKRTNPVYLPEVPHCSGNFREIPGNSGKFPLIGSGSGSG